ncbi:MAG: transposase [Panacagrimonas sp.]
MRPVLQRPQSSRSLDGRQPASWLDLTPREHSSGTVRKLGGISKRGDRYARMLLTHGAHAVLLRAGQLQRAGQPLNALRRWALALRARSNHNQSTCALANKVACIAWATSKHGTVFDPDQAAMATRSGRSKQRSSRRPHNGCA